MYSTGATVISNLLMNNCVIQHLNMNLNTIGDDGITAIATSLTNSRISRLQIWGCGITVTGTRSLAVFLSINQSIRLLLLYNNPITTEGARLILQSAVNNEACQAYIKINNEYSRDGEVETLINIMEGRRRIKAN